jgi:lysophospholipase L1-like esterase
VSNYTLNFPLYGTCKNLYIGVKEGSVLTEGRPYRDSAPIVYYGSSITQGGCASRPGLAYQSIISRQLNVDHINLGFSGNGKAEDAIVDYMATLDPLIFVSDYDHNTTSHPHLDESHRRLYEKIRAAHPDVPYVMISRPDFIHADSLYRRKIIMDHYMEGIAAGDRNLYFIDGESFFAAEYDKGDCTVDGCHPNDRGFALMADRIGSVLRMILKGQRYL